MPYVVHWESRVQEVQEAYLWLDQFCPSWQFEATNNSTRRHEKIRQNNEEYLSKISPGNTRIVRTGVRVETEQEAMAAKLRFIGAVVTPLLGALT